MPIQPPTSASAPQASHVPIGVPIGAPIATRDAGAMRVVEPPVRAFRSAVLGWSDQETGDRLTINVRGSPSFVENLGRLGFEALDACDRTAIPAAKGELAANTSCVGEPQPAPGVEHVTVRISRGAARVGAAPTVAFRRVESARLPA